MKTCWHIKFHIVIDLDEILIFLHWLLVLKLIKKIRNCINLKNKKIVFKWNTIIKSINVNLITINKKKNVDTLVFELIMICNFIASINYRFQR